VARLGLPSRVGSDPGVQKPAKHVRDMTATNMSALKQLEMVRKQMIVDSDERLN
jgi:hypothetical protein